MMQKKYLVMPLIAASLLLTGCSGSGVTSTPTPDPTVFSSNRGLIHPSTTAPETPSDSKSEGVLQVPASITQNPDYVPIPFTNVSGTVTETPSATTVRVEAVKLPETRKWVKDLISKGWVESAPDTVDTASTYSVVLMKDSKILMLNVNNTDNRRGTMFSFSK